MNGGLHWLFIKAHLGWAKNSPSVKCRLYTKLNAQQNAFPFRNTPQINGFLPRISTNQKCLYMKKSLLNGLASQWNKMQGKTTISLETRKIFKKGKQKISQVFLSSSARGQDGPMNKQKDFPLALRSASSKVRCGMGDWLAVRSRQGVACSCLAVAIVGHFSQLAEVPCIVAG